MKAAFARDCEDCRANLLIVSCACACNVHPAVTDHTIVSGRGIVRRSQSQERAIINLYYFAETDVVTEPECLHQPVVHKTCRKRGYFFLFKTYLKERTINLVRKAASLQPVRNLRLERDLTAWLIIGHSPCPSDLPGEAPLSI